MSQTPTISYRVQTLKQYVLYSLIIPLMFCANTSLAQYSGFDWIYQIGTSSNEIVTPFTIDSQGNTYIAGVFKDTLYFGTDSLISQTPGIYGAKIDAQGKVKWLKSLPVNYPQNIFRIALTDIEVSQSEKIFVGGYITRTGLAPSTNYLLSIRSDESIAYHIEEGFLGYSHLAVDKEDNIYYSIADNSLNDTWIGKFDSSGTKGWGFYFVPSTTTDFKLKNLEVINDTVCLSGDFKGNTTFQDMSGTTPIPFISNDRDVYIAKYSRAGKLLGAKTENGILPSANGIGGYTSAFNPNGELYYTWTSSSTTQKSHNIRRYSSELGIQNNYSKGINCILPVAFVYNSMFTTNLLSEFRALCYSQYLTLFDTDLNILDTIVVPFQWYSSMNGVRSFQLDGSDNVFILSNFEKTLEYRDSLGEDSITAHKNSDDLFIAKFHKCGTYNPIVTQSGNILTCNLIGLEYQWLRNGAPVTGATLQNYTPTQTGAYSVQVTDGWGCSNTSSPVQVTVGIVDLNKARNIIVYPNPTTGSVEFKGLPKGVTIEILDVAGKVLYSTHSNETTTQLDFSSYSNGLYFIKTLLGVQKIEKR